MKTKLDAISRRDALAAAAVTMLGLGGVVAASGYRLGELRNIGPGAFPLIVSVLIVVSGVLIAVECLAGAGGTDRDRLADPPRYRVILFVLAGLLSFALLVPMVGAVPGILACVVLSSMADGSLRLWQVATLAALVTGFCAVVFVGLLHLPLDLLKW